MTEFSRTESWGRAHRGVLQVASAVALFGLWVLVLVMETRG